MKPGDDGAVSLRFAVDVPGAVSIEAVGAVLDSLEEHGVAVACPSLRHTV